MSEPKSHLQRLPMELYTFIFSSLSFCDMINLAEAAKSNQRLTHALVRDPHCRAMWPIYHDHQHECALLAFLRISTGGAWLFSPTTPNMSPANLVTKEPFPLDHVDLENLPINMKSPNPAAVFFDDKWWDDKMADAAVYILQSFSFIPRAHLDRFAAFLSRRYMEQMVPWVQLASCLSDARNVFVDAIHGVCRCQLRAIWSKYGINRCMKIGYFAWAIKRCGVEPVDCETKHGGREDAYDRWTYARASLLLIAFGEFQKDEFGRGGNGKMVRGFEKWFAAWGERREGKSEGEGEGEEEKEGYKEFSLFGVRFSHVEGKRLVRGMTFEE